MPGIKRTEPQRTAAPKGRRSLRLGGLTSAGSAPRSTDTPCAQERAAGGKKPGNQGGAPLSPPTSGTTASGDRSGVAGRAAGPHHVAIIMDGNGRWATSRGRPRLFGHQAGARRVSDIVETCPDLGIRYLTIFAFSTENWKRTQTEVSGLMTLFRRYITKEAQRLLQGGVRVRFIGDRERLDPKLARLMDELEQLTAANEALHLTVALNYGGRDEVTRATRRLAAEVAAGRLAPEDVDASTLARFLDTCSLPDPDLVIRTSGEARISNFLLWQSAYAEYEFVDTLWPDFDPDCFREVIGRYGNRDRRFGAVHG